MKKISALFLLMYLPIGCFSSEISLKVQGKKQMKEDQRWGTKQLGDLLESGWADVFEKDDVLPEGDRGKEFKMNQGDNEELKSFVGYADKKTSFEGTEKFFQTSRLVLENPEANIGIVSTQSQEIPEEERLINCQEAGTYQVSFFQKRIVEVAPEMKKQIKHCKGHRELDFEKFFLKSGAEDKAKKRKKELSKDATLESYNTDVYKDNAFGKYSVLAVWKHKDNIPSCNSVLVEEIIIQPSSEKDLWQTDFPEDLATIEGNPNCRLLYTQVIEGPEVRQAGPKTAFRDVWSRRLIFSCEPIGESPCSRLRAEGGVLTKKRCLKENRFGECDLWEKTYDLGKKAAHRDYVHTFTEDEIWGLNDIFDSSYDKNNELPSVVSTLSIFSDLKKELEKSGRISEKEIEIFRGEEMKCQCSFIKGVLYDCCKKMDGLAVATYLATCNSEEQSLAQRRHDGQCHHVGSMKEKLGTQTAQLFCCFQTKLARILHEQGRAQLGIHWGKAEEPICRGLSLNELQSVDFTKIDFSDALDDLSINKDELWAKVRVTIENLQSNGQAEAKQRTGTIVQKQEEAIKNVPQN